MGKNENEEKKIIKKFKNTIALLYIEEFKNN